LSEREEKEHEEREEVEHGERRTGAETKHDCEIVSSLSKSSSLTEGTSRTLPPLEYEQEKTNEEIDETRDIPPQSPISPEKSENGTSKLEENHQPLVTDI